ncbi:MAG: alpha/beta hydrolase [Pseudomonadota bacterium]
MKTHKQSLTHDRFEVPFRCYGDHADVFLCVGGVLQTMAVWREVIRRFSPYFTVVVFDMPGVGRSKILSCSAHVSLDEQVDVVHALVNRIKPAGKLTLAGSSWGTAVATGYAVKHPEAVHQLVLSSFGMKPNDEMLRMVEQAQELYDRRDYAAGAEIIIGMFGQKIGHTYKRQIEAQFANLSDHNAEAFYEHCRNIATLPKLDDWVDLTQIRARTLIINGATDRIIDQQDMWTAGERIPDCECVLIEDVGHFLHFERPEILDHYIEFFEHRDVYAQQRRAP